MAKAVPAGARKKSQVYGESFTISSQVCCARQQIGWGEMPQLLTHSSAIPALIFLGQIWDTAEQKFAKSRRKRQNAAQQLRR